MKTLLVTILLVRLGSSTNQHLVCKSIDDVFSNEAEEDHHPRVQGVPGKRGPIGIKGDRGLPGPQGPPAMVDYERISNEIDRKVEQALVEVRSQIEELQRNFTELVNRTKNRRLSHDYNLHFFEADLSVTQQCVDGDLEYRGKCFVIPYLQTTQNLNYNAAAENCRNIGGLLAEVRDRDEQLAFQAYIRSKTTSFSVTPYIWIGNEYENGNIRYRSGLSKSRNSFLWLDGYPLGSNRQTALFVRKNTGDSQGFFNYPESIELHGVLCERH